METLRGMSLLTDRKVKAPLSFQSPQASLDVTSPVKLVKRIVSPGVPGKKKIGKFIMTELGQVADFSQKYLQPHFVSAIYNATQMLVRGCIYLLHLKYSLITHRKSGFASNNNIIVWDFFSLIWDFFTILCQVSR